MKSKEEVADDLRPKYDLGELLQSGVLGKYADICRKASNAVLLDKDVSEAFPTDEAVNAALRLVIQLAKLPRSQTGKVVEEPAPAGE